MPNTFRGGVHPESHKRDSKDRPLETLPPPPELVLPLSMHIGAPCEPTVMAGDRVLVGSLIANSSAPISAPIHSPVSGRVAAIEPRPHPNGGLVQSIVITNDGLDKPDPLIDTRGSVESLTPKDIIEIARNAGVVGLGGADFPAAAKIQSGIGKTDTLIINCAECEPYITSGYRAMIENTDEILGGVRLLAKALEPKITVMALEANKLDVAERFRERIGDDKSIEVKVLKTKYPQGGEKQLVRAVTGRKVPPGQLPSAVGCTVFNPETAAAIYRAAMTGAPLLTRGVTVAGSAISNPKNLLVRIGTPLRYLISAVGGFKADPYKLILGGPMMGSALSSLDAPVIKSTNALLAFAEGEDRFDPNPTCIHCGKCLKVCPMNLMPLYINMYYTHHLDDELKTTNVSDCIECGSCAYVCPGRLHLTQVCRAAKAHLQDLARKEAQGK